ncbi:MAG: hypothetical protein HYW25_02380 [Candidatus Aenigmarchaeota archaeon]|nr:hypothetical protein [Candidatus Aenigmarchaeota archaeon]
MEASTRRHLECDRRSLRAIATGLTFFGVFHLATGVLVDYTARKQPPAIDTSSVLSYAITSEPQKYATVLEASGLLALGIAGAMAYGSRRTTRSLREDESEATAV